MGARSRSSFQALALVLLACLVASLTAGPSYCSPDQSDEEPSQQQQDERQPPTRGRRQLGLVDEALSLVGSSLALGRRNAADDADDADGDMDDVAGPVTRRPIYTNCPSEPADKRKIGSARLFMVFHRVNDDRNTELRIYESGGKWDAKAMDMLISDYDFDLNKPTLMYTGGFLQDSRDNWLMRVRKNYDLLQGNQTSAAYNLLIFDWSAFSYGDYGRAVSFVPHLGPKLAAFFEHLHQKHNYDLSKLHLICFSLSTHIVGLAARQLAKRQRVGEIIYIDPTGVCFHDGRSFGQKYGARHDDATQTIAKHYNIFGFGSSKFMGGLDIIVNGGQKQPLMSNVDLSLRQLIGFFSGADLTSHMRASLHENLAFDRDADCHEMAYACESYQKFMLGECGSCGTGKRPRGRRSREPPSPNCHLVNTVANIDLGHGQVSQARYKPGTKMFLNTGKTQFCVYQYQVMLQLNDNAASGAIETISSGQFSFAPSAGFQVAPRNRLENKFTQLISLDHRIKSFKERIEMKKHEQVLKAIKVIRIKYLSNAFVEKRNKYSVKYCPDEQFRELIKC